MLSVSLLQDRIGYALEDAATWIATMSYPDLPPWAWGFIGVLVWQITKKLFAQARPSRYRRSRTLQKRASRKNHKRWQKEGRETLNQLRRNSPTDTAAIRQTLNEMTPFGFEYLITEGFRTQGAEIRKIQRVTGDGGIDGMVKIEGRWHLIQAKRYKTPIAASTIKEFLELCINKKMPGVFVATSGFTGPARQLASKQARLRLLDGPELLNQFTKP